MSNNKTNNDSSTEEEETVNTDEQQSNPQQRKPAKEKGDIIACPTRAAPKHDENENVDGINEENEDKETKTYLWRVCQKYRQAFVKSNKQYKANIVRRVIHYVLEDKKGSFWLKLPSNAEDAEPTYKPLKAESQLLLDHIRGVLDRVVELSRKAQGITRRPSPPKKAKSIWAATKKKRPPRREATKKSASKEDDVLPDEVKSLPSPSTRSSASSRMGRGRRVRRPPQWKLMEDSTSEQEGEGEEGTGPSSKKRSRPEEVLSSPTSSNKRPRRSTSTTTKTADVKGKRRSSKESASSSSTGTGNTSSSGSSSGSEEEEEAGTPTSTKKTQKTRVKESSKIQPKSALLVPNKSKSKKSRKEGEKRVAKASSSSSLPKPRRRLYHPPAMMTCWKRMAQTTAKGPIGDESKDGGTPSTLNDDLAMSKAMEHYVAVFGHTQIPPGWIGNVSLAHWASLQRQVMREWVHNYRTPTPQDYVRLKPFLQPPIDGTIINTPTPPTTKGGNGDAVTNSSDEFKEKKIDDGKQDESEARNQKLLTKAIARNTVMLWDGIVGSRRAFFKDEKEGGDDVFAVSLLHPQAQGGKQEVNSKSPADQNTNTIAPTTTFWNNNSNMGMTPQYHFQAEEDALVI